MEYEIRTKSLITNKETLEHLYTLKQFPVFIGCTEKPQSEDVREDMIFDICTESGMIQLRNLLPLDVVYNQFHSEALGEVWKAHHKAFAEFIQKFEPNIVLEIGGSSGVIAALVLEKNNSVSWTNIEPNPPETMPNPNIKLISSFFDNNFKPEDAYDTVVHSHLLEHLYSPQVALEHIYKILPEGGKHIFTIPNLYEWLKSKFPNTLNFEHTFFLTEAMAEYIISVHGFRVIEKQKFQNHSIFFATEKVKNLNPLPIPSCYEEYKQLYKNFVTFHEEEVSFLNKKLDAFEGKVYLFGAHIFSQALLQFGLNEKKLTSIIDNSTIKQGKRLYGSGLTVQNPEALRGVGKVAVILRAGVYNQEITQQLLTINPEVNIF